MTGVIWDSKSRKVMTNEFSVRLVTLSLVRGYPRPLWNGFWVQVGSKNGCKSDPKVIENEVHREVYF